MTQHELTTAEDVPLEDHCERLGELIGLGGPVPPEVYLAAVEDAEYGRDLMLCRETPPLRDFLVANPPRPAATWAAPAAAAEPSARELLGEASRSFWQWTKSGFAVVDEETYERRFGICLACSELREPGDGKLARLAEAGVKGEKQRKVCGLCGCVASRKARLPHEACPAGKWLAEVAER